MLTAYHYATTPKRFAEPKEEKGETASPAFGIGKEGNRRGKKKKMEMAKAKLLVRWVTHNRILPRQESGDLSEDKVIVLVKLLR